MNPVLQKTARLQVQALITDLREQIEEYELLREDGLDAIKLESPEDFFLLPVRVRIAKHMTQDAFSKLVGVGLRQIARYEKDGYESIRGDTFRKILEKMPISVKNSEIKEKR
jgi:DNA-binding XRE family transcriptional regulator